MSDVGLMTTGPWQLETGFSGRLRSLLLASRGELALVHGYRTPEQSAQWWDKAVKEFGSRADQMIAPPGESNHERGVAADLTFVSDDAFRWFGQNLARYGLEQPMPWEPWHIEPMGLRHGSYLPDQFEQKRGAYTWREGQIHPADRGLGSEGFATVLRGALRGEIPEASRTQAVEETPIPPAVSLVTGAEALGEVEPDVGSEPDGSGIDPTTTG